MNGLISTTTLWVATMRPIILTNVLLVAILLVSSGQLRRKKRQTGEFGNVPKLGGLPPRERRFDQLRLVLPHFWGCRFALPVQRDVVHHRSSRRRQSRRRVDDRFPSHECPESKDLGHFTIYCSKISFVQWP